MPQVTVKPMEQHGIEGNRRSWVDHLQTLAQVIGTTQAQNPVYSPFAPGTPTLGAQQLIESARQNAQALALEQERLNRQGVSASSGIPDTKVMKYSLANAAAQMAEEAWDNYVISQGLKPGEVPSDTLESEKWINSVMPGLKAGIYDQVIRGYGGTTKDAEELSMTIENFLRSRAGLRTKLPDDKDSQMDELRQILGLGGSSGNAQ